MRNLAYLAAVATLFLGWHQTAIAQSQDAETVPYIFKNGDTLNGFASRYLVNREAAQTLQRVNGIKDPTKIRPGTVLKVPTSLLRGTPIGAKIVAFSGTVSIIGKMGSTAPTIGAQILEGQTVSTGAPGFLTIAIANIFSNKFPLLSSNPFF